MTLCRCTLSPPHASSLGSASCGDSRIVDQAPRASVTTPMHGPGGARCPGCLLRSNMSSPLVPWPVVSRRDARLRSGRESQQRTLSPEGGDARVLPAGPRPMSGGDTKGQAGPAAFAGPENHAGSTRGTARSVDNAHGGDLSRSGTSKAGLAPREPTGDGGSNLAAGARSAAEEEASGGGAGVEGDRVRVEGLGRARSEGDSVASPPGAAGDSCAETTEATEREATHEVGWPKVCR